MSKGLEALKIIKHTTDLDRPNELNGYHNEICDIEKELKALEIIKDKRVDIDLLIRSDDAIQYSKKTRQHIFVLPLTQAEFDFLRRVFNDTK